MRHDHALGHPGRARGEGDVRGPGRVGRGRLDRVVARFDDAGAAGRPGPRRRVRLALIRLYRGPSLIDRVVAADML
ncbi:hypothetical protein AB0G13_34755, partial [Micromonospora sp. NPDC023633]